MLATVKTLPSNILRRPIQFLQKDGRHFQILYLGSFLLYGIFFLGWDADLFKISLTISTCLLTQALLVKVYGYQWHSLKSAAISSLGLSILLKTNLPATVVVAAILTIASKFLIKVDKKHIFNPVNFGLIATMLLTGDGWISPGQWGSSFTTLFFVAVAGLIVVLRVARIDTSIAFVLSFFGLEFIRSVLYLGWPMDHFVHFMTNGTNLLFTFFMITDPVTTPNHPKARILWAVMVGALAFILTHVFYLQSGAPIWALFIISPLTPMFDYFLQYRRFAWLSKPLLLLMLGLFCYGQTSAFCGFYVAKADAKLFNKSSQVILVRDGDHTVITMSNDFQGDVKDFAIVVPVPVILEESDIRVVQQYVFDKFDAYTAPRLVEYWDDDPCWKPDYRKGAKEAVKATMSDAPTSMDAMEDSNSYGVTIEAQYAVGEYDILLLSAQESGGLKRWLLDNGYKIPADADEVLDPYILDGTKFFVAKVNMDKFNSSGYQTLNPIQIQFNSPKFMLPIRLGMANASGTQDLIIHAFTRKGRVEVSNYRTTKLPTDRDIPEFVLDQGLFGDFYKSLFDRAWRNEGRNTAMLEYAWDVSSQQPVKCDPCPTPLITFAELREAGVWWLTPDQWGAGGYTGDLFVTRLHVRYGREKFPQDLQFIATPNKQNFQGRYVIRHEADGDLDCPEGKRYQAQLRQRRRLEVQELAALTGWNVDKYSWYYGGTDPLRKSSVPLPEPPGPKDGGTTLDGSLGANETQDTQSIELASDAQTVAEREAFIDRAKAEAKPPVNKRYVLFGIAMAFLAVGLVFRRLKKSTPKS